MQAGKFQLWRFLQELPAAAAPKLRDVTPLRLMSWLSYQLSQRTDLLIKECMMEFSQIELCSQIRSAKKENSTWAGLVMPQTSAFLGSCPSTNGSGMLSCASSWLPFFFLQCLCYLLQCRAHHYSSDGHEVGKKTTTSRHREESLKTKTNTKHNPNTKNKTTPTKRPPKKARTRVKRCETYGIATLKLSNVLLQEVVPNTVRRSFKDVVFPTTCHASITHLEAFSRRWLPPAQGCFHPLDR